MTDQQPENRENIFDDVLLWIDEYRGISESDVLECYAIAAEHHVSEQFIKLLWNLLKMNEDMHHTSETIVLTKAWASIANKTFHEEEFIERLQEVSDTALGFNE